MAVPHPETPMHMRPGVSGPADWAFVRAAATRREEVLLALGEPDLRWRDDRVFAYHWDGTELLIIIASRNGNVIDVPKQHFLLIGFDAQGVVTQIEERHDQAFDWVSVSKLQETWGKDPR